MSLHDAILSENVADECFRIGTGHQSLYTGSRCNKGFYQDLYIVHDCSPKTFEVFAPPFR